MLCLSQALAILTHQMDRSCIVCSSFLLRSFQTKLTYYLLLYFLLLSLLDMFPISFSLDYLYMLHVASLLFLFGWSDDLKTRTELTLGRNFFLRHVSKIAPK